MENCIPYIRLPRVHRGPADHRRAGPRIALSPAGPCPTLHARCPVNATPAPTEPHVMSTYGRVPILLTHGRGCRVWTPTAERLDALAGIASTPWAGAHPRLVRALQDQVAQPIHVSNYYYLHPVDRLVGRRLCERLWPGLACFSGSSGLEANEAALKSPPCAWPRQGHRPAADRRVRARLHGQPDRDAVGHRQPQGAGGLRAAGGGIHPRADQRSGGCSSAPPTAIPTSWWRCSSRPSRAKKAACTRSSRTTWPACVPCATSATGC